MCVVGGRLRLLTAFLARGRLYVCCTLLAELLSGSDHVGTGAAYDTHTRTHTRTLMEDWCDNSLSLLCVAGSVLRLLFVQVQAAAHAAHAAPLLLQIYPCILNRPNHPALAATPRPDSI